MTNSILQHPATSPTTIITFDGIIDLARGRTAVNSEDFGSTTGTSRQAASNRSKADTQISFTLSTSAIKSVREKVKELATLFKNSAKDDMAIITYFADGGTIIYTGKLIDERGIFLGGVAATKYDGTLDMNVSTEIFS